MSQNIRCIEYFPDGRVKRMEFYPPQPSAVPTYVPSPWPWYTGNPPWQGPWVVGTNTVNTPSFTHAGCVPPSPATHDVYQVYTGHQELRLS